jgi:hypothetical protein
MPRSPVVDVPEGSDLTVLAFCDVAESVTSAPPTVTVEPAGRTALVRLVRTCRANEPVMTVPVEGEAPEVAMTS